MVVLAAFAPARRRPRSRNPRPASRARASVTPCAQSEPRARSRLNCRSTPRRPQRRAPLWLIPSGTGAPTPGLPHLPVCVGNCSLLRCRCPTAATKAGRDAELADGRRDSVTAAARTHSQTSAKAGAHEAKKKGRRTGRGRRCVRRAVLQEELDRSLLLQPCPATAEHFGGGDQRRARARAAWARRTARRATHRRCGPKRQGRDASAPVDPRR
ncbi:hypothetical protein ERJ75_000627800 [Trypanosoma vivax]|nr:hypothetical protein ERJ75_000627800 [Trypanosoma vivax]